MKRRDHVVLFVLLAFFVGCPKSSTYQTTLRATVAAVDGAREGFLAYDAKAQDNIVDEATSFEDGKTKLKAYYEKRTVVVKAFTVAYSALAVAAIDPKPENLSTAIAAVGELYTTVRDLKTLWP